MFEIDGVAGRRISAMSTPKFSVTLDPEQVADQRPGWLERRLIRKMLRPVTVSRVEHLADSFVLVELTAPFFADFDWQPAQRFGLILDAQFVSRTYTPLAWNTAAATMRFLVFRHGLGLASDWVGRVRPGDLCGMVGPVPSIDLPAPADAAVLFGDERSIATAASIANAGRVPRMRYVFEANDSKATREVLHALGVDTAGTIQRQSGDAHLSEIRAALTVLPNTNESVILTGGASSIQRLRRELRPATRARIISRAYWASGKRGLT